MIDEEVLTSALHDVADSFEISDEAANRILDEARGSAAESESRSLRAVAFIRSPGRSRTILAAAAAVLVIGGISLPLMRNENGSPVTAALATKKPALGSPTLTVAGSGLVAEPPGASGNSGKTVTLTSAAYLPARETSSSSGTAGLTPRIESSGYVDLTIKEGRVESTFASLNVMVTSDGGSVISSQAQVGNGKSGHFANGTIVLQVPQREFNKLVNQVQDVGHSTSITTTSTDVTGQYVDLRARIGAAEASRRQYLTIMARAVSIGDVLAVQAQLNTIQSQIEQLQGQLNVLDNETTYGSLTVNLTTSTQATTVTHRSGLSRAWHGAISGFVAGFEWLIRISGPVLFAALCLGALALLIRLAWRVTRRRKV